jgi:hypothetical protein
MDIKTMSAVSAFVLMTIREHRRNRLSAQAIQGRMDDRFSPNLHNDIWRRLLLVQGTKHKIPDRGLDT